MRQELETFSGLPVELFPHPVQVDPRGSTTRRAPAMAADRQVTITCPGYARYEKGNDLLQEACRMIWQEPGCEQVHVVCQWPEPFTMPDGRQMGPDPTLVADPRFELCNEHLDASTYQALLNRTDLVVLPYRRESYSNRVSRVAIEAAIQGIPILPMCGTWAEELAQLAGGEDVIKAETAEAVAAAVSASVRRLKERRSHALKNSNNIARFHSAKNFHRKLLVLACREL
jgi:glycosyltransferase involved in cell wall biosynthesis